MDIIHNLRRNAILQHLSDMINIASEFSVHSAQVPSQETLESPQCMQHESLKLRLASESSSLSHCNDPSCRFICTLALNAPPLSF